MEWIVEINENKNILEAKWIREIVRCKDCKFYWKNMKDNIYGPVPACLASPKIDAFCSEGERKT